MNQLMKKTTMIKLSLKNLENPKRNVLLFVMNMEFVDLVN
ncbi:unnamed protein product [Schistosoma mattheei]|uniref:Uncharacterized protein n=1 Tax=Schistosoma mattheei TaxID=31246 RepID=A0A183NNT1_9TREM|nr:unnamed protein product [Schistosoma mattheei]